MTVYVRDEVYEAIEEVRQEGRYNMVNQGGVMNELAQKARQSESEVARYDLAVSWMDANEERYSVAIFEGLKPESNRGVDDE